MMGVDGCWGNDILYFVPLLLYNNMVDVLDIFIIGLVGTLVVVVIVLVVTSSSGGSAGGGDSDNTSHTGTTSNASGSTSYTGSTSLSQSVTGSTVAPQRLNINALNATSAYAFTPFTSNLATGNLIISAPTNALMSRWNNDSDNDYSYTASDQFLLVWTPSPTEDITYYEIQAIDVSLTPNVPSIIATIAPTDTALMTLSWLPWDLTHNYSFKITAIILSSRSAGLCIGYSSTLAPPASASYVESSVTATSCTVTWSAVPGATGYQLQERYGLPIGVQGSNTTATLPSFNTTANSFNLTGLNSTTEYRIDVFSYVDDPITGQRSLSSGHVEVLIMTSVPYAVPPGEVIITDFTTTTATLTFNSSTSAISYYISISGESAPQIIPAQAGSVQNLIVQNLSPATAYTFIVNTYDGTTVSSGGTQASWGEIEDDNIYFITACLGTPPDPKGYTYNTNGAPFIAILDALGGSTTTTSLIDHITFGQSLGAQSYQLWYSANGAPENGGVAAATIQAVCPATGTYVWPADQCSGLSFNMNYESDSSYIPTVGIVAVGNDGSLSGMAYIIPTYRSPTG